MAIALATPWPAMAQSHAYYVSAQSVQTGVPELARQAGVQILISGEAAAGRTGAAVKGVYTPQQALSIFLRRTGLEWRQTGPETYSVVPIEQSDAGATPDILVQGKRQWTLNTGIRRTEDDSQPFIVIEGETIRKSGAPDLETFLRNQLSVNASPTTSEQTTSGVQNATTINLRGLGDKETLILIDGRRPAGTTNRDGSLGQPTIAGLPMAAVERIEVLASSASGIYGNGATGGVINIILRRDYRGAEGSLTYSDTFAGGGRGVRADLTGGLALEGGKTNLTFTGSWSKTDPLLYRDRADLIVDGRAQAFANNPNVYRFSLPLAATPNIRSANGQPLRLDPAYGGGLLSSYFTSVPTGYRGVALDGVAPLVGNAGKLALDLSENAAPGGGRSGLLFGIQTAGASLAARRDFNDWFKGYAEASWTRSDSSTERTRVPMSVQLAANAPNNPFTTPIVVTVPFPGGVLESNRNVAQSYRGVVGAIVKLPGNWQAVADLSRMRSTNSGALLKPNISAEGLQTFRDGRQDIVRDVRLAPAFDYIYDTLPWSLWYTPQQNDVLNLSLRLAGKLPFTLPGGQPTTTLSAERTIQDQKGYLRAQNGFSQGQVDVVSPGRQRIDALYSEINLPLIGSAVDIPLIRELSLTASARYERYSETGSPESNCYFGLTYLPTLDVRSLCPASQPSATIRDSHIDPTVSVRWRPIEGVTIRGSYATGYLTPRLTQLVRQAVPVIYIDAVDTLRGGERIGTEDAMEPGAYTLPGFAGGNTELESETSKTFTVGIILQPGFLRGLRLSADWTRITKRDNYFDPSQLLFAEGDAQRQASFDAFLSRYPDRVTRAPASDGFPVGRITSIDVSLANLVGSTNESIDFALGYSRPLFGGTIDLDARATYVSELSLQEVPGGSVLQYAGIITNSFLVGAVGNRDGGFGSLRWKGNGTIRWTGERVGLSWQTRFFDSYFINAERAVDLEQGSAKIAAQAYHDVTASYAFNGGFTVRAGINNVFDKRPPIDSSTPARYYSSYADPRRANFYLTLVKSF